MLFTYASHVPSSFTQSAKMPVSLKARINKLSSVKSTRACDDPDPVISRVVAGVAICVGTEVCAGVAAGVCTATGGDTAGDPGLVHPDEITIAARRAKQKTVTPFCMIEHKIF